ncbi:MAG: hypothetical protein PHV74_02135 [Dehalococcoidia bacterium]|nr:hypothetical protein [Dehalococcoidia bacterium]
MAACLKFFQVAPGWAGFHDLDYELINKNHGVVTIKRCPALENFEKHYGEERIELVCHQLEADYMNDYTHFFNAKMKATPVLLPPRQTPRDIACRWEFKLGQ